MPHKALAEVPNARTTRRPSGAKLASPRIFCLPLRGNVRSRFSASSMFAAFPSLVTAGLPCMYNLILSSRMFARGMPICTKRDRFALRQEDPVP